MSTIKKKVFGLLGSLFLFLAMYVPLTREGMSYVDDNSHLALIIFLLAVLSFFITIFEKYKALLVPGIISLIIFLLTMSVFSHIISQVYTAKSYIPGAYEPKTALGLFIMSIIRLGWGWIILFSAVAFLIAAAIIKSPEPHYTPGDD